MPPFGDRGKGWQCCRMCVCVAGGFSGDSYEVFGWLFFSIHTKHTPHIHTYSALTVRNQGQRHKLPPLPVTSDRRVVDV